MNEIVITYGEDWPGPEAGYTITYERNPDGTQGREIRRIMTNQSPSDKRGETEVINGIRYYVGDVPPISLFRAVKWSYHYYQIGSGQYSGSWVDSHTGVIVDYTEVAEYARKQNPDKGSTPKVPILPDVNTGDGGSSPGPVHVGDLAKQVEDLQKMLSAMLAQPGGGVKRYERLTINSEDERSRVEAALRFGLNNGDFDLDQVKKESVTLITGLSQMTGLPESKVASYLRSTVASGASALTMALSGGNFPLGAAVYFGTQALMPNLIDRQKDEAGNPKKIEFKGYSAEGSIEGHPLVSTEIKLPYGLPHDIFGPYRFTCYDHLTGKWMPSDEIEPIQYWSNDPYRYTCLDRINSKIYHADKIKAVRLYV